MTNRKIYDIILSDNKLDERSLTVEARRNTRQRALIYQLVSDDRTHPTAEDIYKKARALDSTISLGTVYRNLGKLSDEGMVLRIQTPEGPDHFDFNLSGHYHFCCRMCGKVADSSIPYGEALKDSELEKAGFRIEWHLLSLVGLCPECLKIEKNNI